MLETRENRGAVEVPPVELRSDANGQRYIEGYGIVFNRDSENMGFVEQIDPGSVDKTLSEADVRSCGNHDTSWLLGRTKAGTLQLTKDGYGVKYRIPVNENDPDHVRAAEKVQRGDWDGSSFSFETIQDRWNWDANPPERRILEMKLVTIEPVTFPAYPDSTVAMARSKAALSRVAEKLGHPVERMVAALQAGEIRSLINTPTEAAKFVTEYVENYKNPAEETTVLTPKEALEKRISGVVINVNGAKDPAETARAVAEHLKRRTEERAVWSTAYINDLPDSAFLYIEDGGEKDADGKTTPRTLRHFPYKDDTGKIDLPHLRDALARIPDSNLPDSVKSEVTAKAEKILAGQKGENSAEALVEERVGKTISKATAAQLSAIRDMIEQLLDPGEPDNDEDDGTERPDMTEMQPARSMDMVAARAKLRQREQELAALLTEHAA